MSNLPSRMLRLLCRRRHAFADVELRQQFPAHRVADLDRAVRQLRTAQLVTWTSQGWLITALGITFATGGLKLSFEAPRVTA